PESAAGDAVAALIDRAHVVSFPPGDIAGVKARAAQMDRAGATEAGPPAGGAAEARETASRPPWGTIAASALCGAIAGGGVAVAALFYGATVLFPADARLEVVERRLAAVETQAGGSEAAIGRLSADVAEV